MVEKKKVSKKDPVIRKIVEIAYPAYKGRKIALVPQRYPLNCKSYWDGGSRSYFVSINLRDFSKWTAPAQSMFDKQIDWLDKVNLPDHEVMVEHTIFCGKDLGLRIHCSPAMYTELSKAVQA